MIFIGIDWSQTKHDIGYMDDSGRRAFHQVIAHSQIGFQKFHEQCEKLGLEQDECQIGIETSYNLLVDELWSYGYSNIYVIPPSVVKSSRGRFGNSGARNDKSDAFMLADLVRTDRRRLHPWKPDTLLTRQMRVKVRALYQLTHQITAATNQLRAVLQRYYPGVLQIFGDLTAQTALAFIQEYPTPASAAQLSQEEFYQFLCRQRYSHRRRLAPRLSELRNPSLKTRPDTVAIYQEQAQLQAQLLLQMVKAKLKTQRELTVLFKSHPDADIFTSLPGTGALLAPALLVKFGDHRDRFPTAASVQALAGTCPVTDSSGQRHRVYFRRGCDREFRHYAQQWAIASSARHRSQFADAYQPELLNRGFSKHHVYRCLANRWLAIAWRLWQDRIVYDEAYHMQQRLRRFRPNSLT